MLLILGAIYYCVSAITAAALWLKQLIKLVDCEEAITSFADVERNLCLIN